MEQETERLASNGARTGIISVMPQPLANKIAAGEVVQRPASVVKELVENAIDAGAGRISVVLSDAGSTLIQVTDDGAGMDHNDALLCFERHATSKIRSVEDLENIHTLGFRGEALASIASVSQVEMKTARTTDPAGTLVRIEGGENLKHEPCASIPGTSISIRNLFFNVPARRNFLKRPQTELKHILDTVEVLALSNPDTAFDVVHDGMEHLQMEPETGSGFFDRLVGRAASLSTVRNAEGLIPVDESTSYLSVRGVVGPPESARKTRGQQYLFVNGRHVRHHYLEHAVTSAFEYLIPEGAHPFFALFLTIDPRHVDVNVHPTKSEVKFDDERGVYGMLRAVVRRAVGESGLTADFEQARPLSGFDLDPVSSGGPAGGASFSSPLGGARSKTADGAIAREFSLQGVGEASRRLYGERSVIESGATSEDADSAPSNEREDDLLWQLHDAYILTQIRSGLVIVDQQAAHERVLYEQARDCLDSGFGMSQQLLFPQTYDMSATNMHLLSDLAEDLARLGFDIETAGKNKILVRGVPTDIRSGDERIILDDILDQYRAFERVEQLKGRENLARSMARRAAVRAGVKLSSREMRALIDQLFQCGTPFMAPDGRPTLVKLSVDELRARFENR